MPRARPSLLLLAVLALGAVPAGRAQAAPPGVPANLHGVARGIVVAMDPYFRWEPSEARSGVIGTMTGTTKEFEEVTVEVGADRRVATAGQRLAYEAYRVKHEVEPGELQTTEIKGDVAAVRLKLKDGVYLCAARQLGRTTLFVRAVRGKKDEPALTKVMTSILANAKPAADDVNGWLPPEVKATWTKKTEGDLLVVDDGTLEGPGRDAAIQAVRSAFALVRGTVGSGGTPFPPVVRVTASRDLFSHLAGRRDLVEVDAVHVPDAAELLVCPRKREEPDVRSIAVAAARHALHHALGAAGGEPLETGLARRAEAATEGGEPGALLARDADRAIARVKAKEAWSWTRIAKLPSVVRVFGRPDEERAIDAELSAVWLGVSGGPLAKATLTAWTTAMRKTGHPDAATEAAYVAGDPGKMDAEWWAWWTARAEPPPKKPGKPGQKPAAPPTPPTSPNPPR